MADLKAEATVALKGRFRAPNQRYYGQFFFLINQKGGYIEVASVVITTGPDLFNALNPTDSWKKYEALINKLKYENRYSQSITNEFQGKLKQLTLDKQYFADLLKAMHSGKQDSLNFVLASFYRRVIKDDEFYLESVAEKASLADTDAQETTPATQATAADDNGLYLPIKLDLDPISGKDVKELRPGDKILVRVLPQTDRANAFIDSNSLRTESGFIKSAQFIITSVTYPGVGVELVGRIADGVYGRIVEEQNVLVRANEVTKKTTSSPAQKIDASAETSDKKQLFVIAGGIFGVVVLGIVLYFVASKI